MGQIIATVGKGGTGKTTLASLIIRHLVRLNKRPVLAIDADANDNLGDGIGMKKAGSIAWVTDDFFKNKANFPAGMTKETFLEQQLNMVITEGKDVDMLVMGHPEGPGCYCYINNILRAQMEKLGDNYPYIVVDNEAGMEHVSRRTTRRFDTMLLVADFSAKAIKAAGRIREVAIELELEVNRMGLVLNRAPEDISPLKKAIEETGLSLLATLPTSAAVLDNDVTGQPVFHLPDDDPVVAAVGELVDKIV